MSGIKKHLAPHSELELANMAKATSMKDGEIAANLRTIAHLFGDEDLAKWVLGVAAERIEKHAG